MKLSSSNYVGAAQESLSASSAAQSSTSLLTGAEVSNSSKLLNFVQAQLPNLPGWLQSPQVVTGATTSSTEQCSGGGSVNFSVNDRNGNQILDSGDTFTMVATNCNFDGDAVSGQVSVTVNTLTGDLSTYGYAVNFDMAFAGLSVATAAGRDTVSGNLRLQASSSSVYSNTETLSSASLALTSVYGGTSYSRLLTGYSTTLGTTPTQTGYLQTSTSSGTLTSTNFASQSVAFSTLTPFARTDAQAYPAVGQLQLVGADGSKARVTAQSSSQVLIELDADGNAVYETSSTKAWSELL